MPFGVGTGRSLTTAPLALAAAVLFQSTQSPASNPPGAGRPTPFHAQGVVPASVLRAAAADYAAGKPKRALQHLSGTVSRAAGSLISRARIEPGEALLAARLLRVAQKPSEAVKVLNAARSGRTTPAPGLSHTDPERRRFLQRRRILAPYLRLELARALADAGKREKAASVLWLLREKRDTALWWEALQLQAECFWRTGKWLAAALAYKELADSARPSELRAFFRLSAARCRLRRGQASKAARLLRQAAIQDAGSAWDAEVLTELEALKKKRPKVKIREFRSAELNRRAARLMTRMRAAAAAETYRKVAERYGKSTARNLNATIGRARALLVAHRPAEALKLLKPIAARRGETAARAERHLQSAMRRLGRFDLLSERLCTRAGRGRRCAKPGRGRRTPERQAMVRAAARALLLAGRYSSGYRLLAWTAPSTPSFLKGYLALKAGRTADAVRVFTALRNNAFWRKPSTYWLAVALRKSSKSVTSSKSARSTARSAARSAARSTELLKGLAARRPLGYYGLMALARLGGLGGSGGGTAGPSTGPRPRPVAWYRKSRPSSPDRVARALESAAAAPAAGFAVRIPLLRVAALVRIGFLAEARNQFRWFLSCHTRKPQAKTRRPLSRTEALFIRPCGKKARARLRSQKFSALMAAPAVLRALRNAARHLDEWALVRRVGGASTRRRLPMPLAARVNRWAKAHAVRPSWIWAVMKVESAYDPLVVSWAGAAGLMQIMPHTARRIAKAIQGKSRFGTHRLLNADLSVRFGSWYLGQLYVKFQAQLPLALAAYNGGPHNVVTWLKLKGGLPLDEFVEEIPFTETRQYVKKTLRYAVDYSLRTGDPVRDLVGLQLKKDVKNNIDF